MTVGGDMPGTARTRGFVRNDDLESLLRSLNARLWIAEEQVLSELTRPRFPIILIMGPLRSGTTLLMQWLASTGIVAYPTNLLSRFFGAPALGAQIQLMLTDGRFNFRDELGEFSRQIEYSSENGKTRGVLAPNEFWYFWRRFFPDPTRDAWTDEELRAGLDAKTMLAELAGLTEVFAKPFAAKGLLFNYNIPFINALLDRAIFVQIKREPLQNIQSVLAARERQLGDRRLWYSFKIAEFDDLKNLDPISQAAGQVACINRAVEAGLRGVADERKIVLSYEAFCKNPAGAYDELLGKLSLQGYSCDVPYSGPAHFAPVDKVVLSPAEADLAMQVYQQYLTGKS